MEILVSLSVAVAFAVASYFLGVDSRESVAEQVAVAQRPRRAI
jgi:hypothetical protein